MKFYRAKALILINSVIFYQTKLVEKFYLMRSDEIFVINRSEHWFFEILYWMFINSLKLDFNGLFPFILVVSVLLFVVDNNYSLDVLNFVY
jgi:hypothetical protein